jgi:predicted DNA-binding protein (MmcQ/YjbR family)
MATLKQAFDKLRAFALRYPDVREDHPWGETAIKVKGKTFVFMGVDKTRLGLSLKLPHSREFALEMHAFPKPTPYGLGKAGWVTAEFFAKDKPPLDILEAWIDESFRAIAPKKVVAAMEEKRADEKPAQKAVAKKSPVRKKAR